MSPNSRDAIKNVAHEMLGDRALLPISSRRAHRRDADKEQTVAENVAGEGGRRSKAQDDPACEGWPDKQSELAIGGADRNRGDSRRGAMKRGNSP